MRGRFSSFEHAVGDSGGCGWIFGFGRIWLGRRVIVGEASVGTSFRGIGVLSLLRLHPSI